MNHDISDKGFSAYNDAAIDETQLRASPFRLTLR